MHDVSDRRDDASDRARGEVGEDVGVGARERVDETARAAAPAAAAERPLTEGEKDRVKVVSAPATAAAGAVAGAAAGMAVPVFGPFGSIVGAIVGALAGAAAGGAHAVATDDLYTTEHDEYYRSLWDATSDRPADRTFESARPAYQFGHVAARSAGYAGRDFAAVEPELRQRWPDDLRANAGDWDAVRPYVEAGYGYSHRQWLAAQRDSTVVGSGGSAVNPEELGRARAGLSSVEEGRA